MAVMGSVVLLPEAIITEDARMVATPEKIEKRTTRLRPLCEDPTIIEPSSRCTRQEIEAACARKGDRAAAARLRLAQRVQSQCAAVDRKAAQIARTHNENNQLAVERGNVPDLPYLEELVDSMRSEDLLTGFSGKSGRQQRKILDELMKETLSRNTGALTDVIAKACSCSKVTRKPDRNWHILSGTNEATEYILYKSKAKDIVGQALSYGFVIVCHKNGSGEGASTKDILSVMQRGHYFEASIIYTCLECLLNFDLASELLVRVQEKEYKERAGVATSKHTPLLQALMELEDELAAFAEQHGGNKAVKRGEGMTDFDLVGPVSETPGTLYDTAVGISESLHSLLKSISQALRP